MRSRPVGVLLLLAVACVALAGCASVLLPSVNNGPLHAGDNAEVLQASGFNEQDVLGVHWMLDLNYVKAEAGGGFPAYVPVAAIRNGSWTLRFVAPAADHANVSAWFERNRNGLDADFAAMLDVLGATFGELGGRTMTIALVPPGRGYDRVSIHVAISDADVQMDFAFRGPLAGPEAEDRWRTTLFVTLAHEYAHSWWWFHPDGRPDIFSDEVMAYSVQRCVEVRLTGTTAFTLQPAYRVWYDAVKDRTVPEIYAAYRDRSANTSIGDIGAEVLMRRALDKMHEPRDTGLQDTMKEFCRTVVRDLRDYRVDRPAEIR